MVWIISPPNHLFKPVLARYQKVFVASQFYVEHLSGLGIAAEDFPQATDIGLFHPSKRPDGASTLPIVFVGAHAPRARRPIVQNAIAAGLDVRVWGPGWEGVIPERNWCGERLDQDELASVYARARVVLNDHMPAMAHFGMMSNRTYDALSSGASVVCDMVSGFQGGDLPDLFQTFPGDDLIACLEKRLEEPDPDHATRMARHRKIAEKYSFDVAAARFIAAARDILKSGSVSPACFTPRRDGVAPPLDLTPPEVAAPLQIDGFRGAAQDIGEIFDRLTYPDRAPVRMPPTPEPENHGVIHGLMYDLRRAQQVLRDNVPADVVAKSDHIDMARRARRVRDAGQSTLLSGEDRRDATMVRLMRAEPLWHHAPDEFDRDSLKQNVALWPRKAPVPLSRPIGVFVHLYYNELGPVFAERLARIDAPVDIYISTDTEAKAQIMKRDFPQAEIRVLSNRGRDIYPKFYGFADVYDRHDLILHLHGKRSRHSGKLEQWLAHNLECLLPEPEQINRILSFFQTVPTLGVIGPAVFQPVIPAAHWGANFEIAQELAWRMGLDPDNLPGNDALRFPVGSMFWGRRAAIQPLLDLPLRPCHFPPEAKQVDGTTAHAIERMIGVCCQATGYDMVSVVPENSKIYGRFQKHFTNNRAFRDDLTASRTPQ